MVLVQTSNNLPSSRETLAVRDGKARDERQALSVNVHTNARSTWQRWIGLLRSKRSICKSNVQ